MQSVWKHQTGFSDYVPSFGHSPPNGFKKTITQSFFIAFGFEFEFAFLKSTCFGLITTINGKL